MLTKAQSKYIRSLSLQKYRNQYNVFIAEGVKIAEEWLNADAKIEMIVATEDWWDEYGALTDRHTDAELHVVKPHELEDISALQTPNHVLLVIRQPQQALFTPGKEWYLAADDIRDPGNMGTLIRIADWFGINQMLCSQNCVEIYSPKVVQASMGSLIRVKVHTVDLETLLNNNKDLPVFAATLHGDNIYTLPPQTGGIIIIGNESKGVSEALISKASHRITIPRKGGAESLNAAVSAGIICALLIGNG